MFLEYLPQDQQRAGRDLIRHFVHADEVAARHRDAILDTHVRETATATEADLPGEGVEAVCHVFGPIESRAAAFMELLLAGYAAPDFQPEKSDFICSVAAHLGITPEGIAGMAAAVRRQLRGAAVHLEVEDVRRRRMGRRAVTGKPRRLPRR